MNEHQIGLKQAAAMLQKPLTVEIDIVYPTFWERITRRKKEVFKLKPITLGKLIAISELMLAIEPDSQKQGMDFFARLAVQSSEKLARIVGICLSPKRTCPERLVGFLMRNLSATELNAITMTVLSQLDVNSFLLSIVTMRGTGILPGATSPQGLAEMIAPEKAASGELSALP